MRVGEVYRCKHSDIEKKLYIPDILVTRVEDDGSPDTAYIIYLDRHCCPMEGFSRLMSVFGFSFADFELIQILSREEMLTHDNEHVRLAADNLCV